MSSEHDVPALSVIVGGKSDRLEPGARVGEYEIRREIDTGGMATVYAAVHPVIGKQVAIKILAARFSHDRDVVDRFILEARAVNQIGHVNIVDIFSFGELPDGRHYCVMELLQGEPLDERIRRMPGPTYEELFSALCQVADALEAAHQVGIVHRDLKPENVVLVPSAGGDVVKLLDFGVAKPMKPQPGRRQTDVGILVGTPEYMSPEQCRGKDVDGRSDVYALGVIMYEVFSGRLPFQSETPLEILTAHVNAPPPAPVEIAAFSPALADLVMACLDKDPAARPASALEVHDRLLEIARDEDLDLGRVGPATTTSAVSPRRLAALTGAILVLALAAIGLSGVISQVGSYGGSTRTEIVPLGAALPRPDPLPAAVAQPVTVAAALELPDPAPVHEPEPEPRSRARRPRAAAPAAGTTAPVIGDISFDPMTTEVGQTVTVTGWVDFEDPDGDVRVLGSQIRAPGKRAKENPKSRLSIAGASDGSAAFTFAFRPAAAGVHSFDVWVIDSRGNMSNVLTGEIEVDESP